ncbi:MULTISPECIES: TRAP transporter small permease [Bacillus]|uniref:C4-dicarboxylate ABC transporter permease n=1 Tax=Bacillus infantis NRRL B-14911 TaxID=1367477 RepID=U5LI82_9BACI|nr:MULTISPECIES: TRAP transporter small permease [Bacillus]AGX06332.1 C4-dicarboxylate ABC transporter permease [Bacillus infantis NRRL B-14911]EAR68744.1 TRAP-type transport system permease small protein [Bacillus sp. NRRL B-14911]MCA1033633.1 TRAP transporter small permease [Bacillus infantis]MDT0162076.1 TRAP transporter small permease [Bacillus sp. AG4(2022)]
MKIRIWLDRALSFLTVASFSGVIIVVMIQIMSRYLPYTAIWTEELTRYLFLYAICFGAPLALLRGEFINVDLIFAKMSHNVRRFYEVFIYLLILFLGVILVKEGWFFYQLGKNQTSATMPFQMSAIHASILIMSIFLVLYSIVKIIRLIRNKEDFNSQIGGGEL